MFMFEIFFRMPTLDRVSYMWGIVERSIDNAHVFSFLLVVAFLSSRYYTCLVVHVFLQSSLLIDAHALGCID